jgi:hypothetical protein
MLPLKKLPQPQYHQSELHAFIKCGKLWEFRYLRGIRVPPRAALTLGSAVDHAVSHNLRQKIESGQDLPREEVLASFSDDFESRAGETDWREDETPDKQKDVGVKLLELHHQEVAPRIKPESVQETLTVETDAGYSLGGTIDIIEKDGSIVDTKTSRVAYDAEAPKRALQPALYDYLFESAHKEPSPEFRYDVLIKPTARNPARLQQVRRTLEKGDREWLFETVARVHQAIQAGVALPAPEGSWYCSRQWCGYWDRCKGRKN